MLNKYGLSGNEQSVQEDIEGIGEQRMSEDEIEGRSTELIPVYE